jgi:hypothetical protein
MRKMLIFWQYNKLINNLKQIYSFFVADRLSVPVKIKSNNEIV